MPEVSFEITPADRPAFERILASSGFFYDFEIEVALSLADETFQQGQEKSGYYWVRLLEEGEVIGFANCRTQSFISTLVGYLLDGDTAGAPQ